MTHLQQMIPIIKIIKTRMKEQKQNGKRKWEERILPFIYYYYCYKALSSTASLLMTTASLREGRSNIALHRQPNYSIQRLDDLP